MLVLMDYDNIPERDRRLGIEHVVRKGFSLILAGGLPTKRPRVRLYGGWYEADRLTKYGQRLSTEIRQISPLRLPSPAQAQPLVADVELAFSSLANPKTLIGNSYRQQSLRDGVQCEQRPWLTCADNLNCPLAGVSYFFSNARCAHATCSVTPRDVLSRMEQKVVDTLVVADLAYANQDGHTEICVVSRDDDVWPGLCLAARTVSRLLHISTAQTSRVPKYYSALTSPPYLRTIWS